MQKERNNALSILSLIFGLIGLVLSCFIIGAIPAIIGLILGIVALINNQSKGMAIIGIICGSISMILALLILSAALKDNDTNVNTDVNINGNHVEVSGSEYVVPESDNQQTDTIWADNFTPINDYRYTLDNSEKTITLIRYEGEDTKILLSPVYNIGGIDYNLISMGDDACFLSETYITSVIIPEGVEEIGGSCFNSCSSLERIYLPSTIKEIPDTFFGYLGKYIVYCNSQISLPSERDENNYELFIDNTTQSEELGEGFARALNGFLGGVNSSDEDVNRIVEIYFGGTDEQWEALIKE